MQHEASTYRDPWPWYMTPIVAPALLPLLLLLPVIALISIPLFWVYPDRHKHLYDVRGTSAQKVRLAQWRAAYDRLGLLGRIRRARIRFGWKRRLIRGAWP